MPLNIAFLIVAIFINVLLGLAVFLQSSKSQGKNIPFYFIVGSVFLWATPLLLYSYASNIETALWLTRLSYFAAGLSGLSLVNFAMFFSFPNLQPGRKILLVSASAAVALVLALVSSSQLLIVGFASFYTDSFLATSRVLQFGSLYPAYVAFISTFFPLGFFILYKQYRNEKESIRIKQFQYIFIGILCTVFGGTITNLVLPSFENFSFYWLGPIFTLVMVAFFTISILRYRLFNTKVITTELFVFGIWVFVLVRALVAESSVDLYLSLGLLGTTILLGFFLIKSVVHEVEQREEIQRLYKELEVKNIKLTELDKLKSQFLSIATHELRTPLTIVRNFISLMMDGTYGKVSPAAEEAGRQVFERVSDMARSVDTYLNVSRIEQGKISYSFADADLTRLTTLAVEGLKANATKRGLTLSLTVKPGAESLKGKYDSPKIAEVLINLIDNSIKYTEKGSVTVLVEKVGNRGVVTIQDTGVGMTEKTKANLFKLFSPGEDSKRINPASTGVGLYVSLAHVVAHKGTLTAASEGPGKGSKFTVELPLV